MLLQDAPSGSWQIQTKLDVSTLTNEGEQAGLRPLAGREPEHVRQDHLHLQGHLRAVRVGGDAQRRVADLGRPADLHAGRRRLPAGQRQRLRHLHRRGLDRRRGLACRSPATITDLGDPETLKFGLKVSDNADTDELRRPSTSSASTARTACRRPRRPTLDAPTPDGELGWYTDRAADHADRRRRRARRGRQDRVHASTAGATCTTYTAPFTVDGAGRARGRVLRRPTRPRTSRRPSGSRSASTARRRDRGRRVEGDPDNGPVKVTLDAADGDEGSGTVLTEYRVDGGPWQTYEAATTSVIFDGSEASLRAVEAGADGQLRPADGRTPAASSPGRRPGHALVPGQAVRGLQAQAPVPRGPDRRRLLQRRRVRALPEPGADAARRTSARRSARPRRRRPGWPSTAATRSSSTTARPARRARPARSTRSTTTTLDAVRLRAEANAASGRTTRSRSSASTTRSAATARSSTSSTTPRARTPTARGDPSTTLRQFTEGYIGLQNHGGADTMQYRNMRVEDLTPGAPKAEDGDRPVRGRRARARTRSRSARSTPPATSRPADVRRSRSARDRRRRPPTTPAPTVVVPLPPVADAAADDRHRRRRSASARSRRSITPRDVRPPRPDGAGGLHGRDGRLGEADGLERDAQAAEAQEQRRWTARTSAAGARTRSTVSLKPSSSLAQALARKGGPKSVKLTLAVQMRDWGKPAHDAEEERSRSSGASQVVVRFRRGVPGRAPGRPVVVVGPCRPVRRRDWSCPMRFLHLADTHLGFRQFAGRLDPERGINQREADVYRAWHHAVEYRGGARAWTRWCTPATCSTGRGRRRARCRGAGRLRAAARRGHPGDRDRGQPLDAADALGRQRLRGHRALPGRARRVGGAAADRPRRHVVSRGAARGRRGGADAWISGRGATC